MLTEQRKTGLVGESRWDLLARPSVRALDRTAPPDLGDLMAALVSSSASFGVPLVCPQCNRPFNKARVLSAFCTDSCALRWRFHRGWESKLWKVTR